MAYVGRPFYESVIGAIETATTPDDFGMIARLIRTTEIPRNHDAIMEAWRTAVSRTGQRDLTNTIDNLRYKKVQAEEEAERCGEAVRRLS